MIFNRQGRILSMRTTLIDENKKLRIISFLKRLHR